MSQTGASGAEWYQDEGVLLELARRRGGGEFALPGYADLREIGRGGQGVVYTATQVSTQRRVAIKVLHGGNGASARRVQRFRREAELVAKLNHPHIVKVYDSGLTPEGGAYLVMEYVEGASLAEVVKRGEYPLGREGVRGMVELVVKIAGAVEYAHQRAVIHRDLKPGNIVLGEGGEPRVLDFGLAKSFGGTGEEAELTTEGQFVGSLQWSAPEQLGGEHVADVRSDVYALGLILYAVVKGAPPYELKGDLGAMVAMLGSAEARSLSESAPSVDGDLAAVCATALAREPERRYQSVREFGEDLGSWLRGEPIRARRDGAWRKLRRRAARARWVLAGSAVVGVALAVALMVSVRSAERVERERDAAKREAEKLGAVLAFVREMLASADPGREGAEVKVVDVLDRAAVEGAEELEGNPAVGAAVKTTLATAQTALGRPQAGLKLAMGALELAERGPGARSIEAGAARLEVANARYHLGEYGESEREAMLAAEIVREARGGESEESVECLAVAAAAMSKGGKLEESLGLKRVILEHRRATRGPAHMDTLMALNNLAVGLTAAKRFEESGALLEEAVAALTASVGAEHPYTIAAESNLASILKRREMHTESAEVLERALRGAKKGFGEDHYTTLIIACNYADSLVTLERYAEAVALFEDTVKRQEAQLGAGHLSTVTTRMNLATARRKSGDLAGAVEGYRAALRDAEGSLPAESERLGQLRENLRQAEEELAGAGGR